MQDDNGKMKAKNVTGPNGAKIVATRPQGDGEPKRERSKGPLGRKREERAEPETNCASQPWGVSGPVHNLTSLPATTTGSGWSTSTNNAVGQQLVANTTNTGFGGWGK